MHVFDVVSDPVHRRILELLGRGEMTSGQVVEAIGAEFGITQAAVSQHLKVLRESGFARVRAEAQRRLYSVDAAGLQAVDAWIGQFRSFWEAGITFPVIISHFEIMKFSKLVNIPLDLS